MTVFPDRRLSQACGCLALALLCTTALRSFAQDEVWELQPYAITVIVADDDTPLISASLRDDLEREILTRSDLSVGAAWSVQVKFADFALSRAMQNGLKQVTIRQVADFLHPEAEKAGRPSASRAADALPAATSEKDPVIEDQRTADRISGDKVMLLALAARPGGIAIQVRELDVRTRIWGAEQEALVGQVERVPEEAFLSLTRAFSPLAAVDDVGRETKEVLLRFRAGALPPRDPAIRFIAPGAIYRPVLRYSDRLGAWSKSQVVPWTYLYVESLEQQGTLARCKTHSGLRDPVTGRRRGRLESLALAVVRPTGDTLLRLESRVEPKRPLAGYEIFAYGPDNKETVLLGRTDREGGLRIEPFGHPLRLLVVKNGGAFLAKLPLVPGLDDELVASVPDDLERLEVEGFITGMQEYLVDLITRRQILAEIIRKSLADGNLDRAESALKRLQSLEDAETLDLRLKVEQSRLRSKDRVIQARIDKLFEDTKTIVGRFIDGRTVEELSTAVLREKEAKEKAAQSVGQ
jgi:hypothetical protein